MLIVRQKQTGFTIVELLIVIVVIAILATISVVTFSGVQARARDAIRADSIAKIRNALELYKLEMGRYPSATPNPGSGGYEVSTDVAGTFMEYLNPYGFSNGAPLDPINDTSHNIRYFRYAAGFQGCDISKGAFITLEVTGFENVASMPQSDPPLVCPTRSWYASGNRYFMYKFEND